MGGKSSKDEPKEETKHPPVRGVQKEFKPTGTKRCSLEPRKSLEMKDTVVQSGKSSTILVAAIHFGTKYSGYAYSFCENPNEIIINYWEKSALKTPTVVLLDDRKRFHSFGMEARTKYEELMKTMEHQKWYLFDTFKMKLFEQDGVNLFINLLLTCASFMFLVKICYTDI